MVCRKRMKFTHSWKTNLWFITNNQCLLICKRRTYGWLQMNDTCSFTKNKHMAHSKREDWSFTNNELVVHCERTKITLLRKTKIFHCERAKFVQSRKLNLKGSKRLYLQKSCKYCGFVWNCPEYVEHYTKIQ